MTEEKKTQILLSLVYSFQMQTMMQLGKLANPMTNTIERDLDAAEMTIDMLDMLKEKTKGNLTEEEKRFIEMALGDLKLNFVEEKSKADNPAGSIDKDKTEILPEDKKNENEAGLPSGKEAEPKDEVKK